jgi:hypothetical protein
MTQGLFINCWFYGLQELLAIVLETNRELTESTVSHQQCIAQGQDVSRKKGATENYA